MGLSNAFPLQEDVGTCIGPRLSAWWGFFPLCGVAQMHATAFLGACWLEATFMFGCVCVSLPKVATPGQIPCVECVKTCWMRKHARPERRQEKQNTDLGLSLGSFEYVEGESWTGKVAKRGRKLAFGGAVPCRVNTAQCSPAAAEGFCLSSMSLIYQWARFFFLFFLSFIG